MTPVIDAPPLVSEVTTKWDEAKKHHDAFCRRWERNERAYRGVKQRAADAPKWRHFYHPPYAFNLVETIVSNTVEMGLTFDVRPAPHRSSSLDEAMQMLDQAEAMNDLLRHEHRVDEMDFKQRPLFLCDAIGGIGIGKSYWNYSKGSIRRQGVTTQQIQDDDGNVMLEVPVISEIVEEGILRDHSTFEVVDPRDFVLHESARALQPFEPGGAQHLFHRCWYSFEQLKVLEADGFFENVDALKEKRNDENKELTDRETEVFDVDRQKDLIEVLEYWCLRSGVVHRCYVGARSVLLRDEEESPFWHGGYPFVIANSMPQLFTTRGMSSVELIAELQEMLWNLSSQRFDNLELVNNFITLVSADQGNVDGWEFYPGAFWEVDGDASKAAQILQPPYQLAEVSMSAEALIKGDLQNVTSAAPFASGAETASVDQKTATGASIVMNAAQQQLAARKYNAQRGLKQEAWMRLKNCQQFITDRMLVQIVGEDGRSRFRELDPLAIQGEFAAELSPMGESQMRQERRAESTQFFQVAMQFAPHMAAAQVPYNVKELFGWMAKHWGIDDWERFFSQQPAAQGMQQMMPGGGAGGGGAGGGGGAPPSDQLGAMQPNLGVTAGSAVDASSPSAAGGISGSPMAAMQRALAMGGGVNNA